MTHSSTPLAVAHFDDHAQPMLSLVFPIFNEEVVIPELFRRVKQMLSQLHCSYEIICVDDGSRDQSFALLCALAAQDPAMKIIRFSRNFGHQMAITAGLDYSRGQATVVMDADLQDPPEVLASLVAKWREGYDVVYAVRSERKGEGLMKRKTAVVFYRLLRALAKIDLPLDTGDFRLMSRRAVDALRTIRERHRFVRGLSLWVGFRQTSVSFVREARYAGKTKYPLQKMLRFAFDGISSFSLVPLQLATYLGLGAAIVGFCAMLYALGVKLFTDHAVPGWASLIVVTLFLGGVQLVTIGIVGEYVGRIYEEVKQRPLYIVAETQGFCDRVGAS